MCVKYRRAGPYLKSIQKRKATGAGGNPPTDKFVNAATYREDRDRWLFLSVVFRSVLDCTFHYVLSSLIFILIIQCSRVFE